MNRPAILAATTLSVLGFGGDAVAAATARGIATLEIQPAAAINVTNTLSLPSVTTVGLAPVSGFGGATGRSQTVVKVASDSLGKAALTISGQAGDAVSMAVPESFRVVRTGGTETLTVKTNTNLEYSLAPDGVILGGALGSQSMSVNVGGALSLASADQPAPGAYQGLLVVVVQYN
jgi:hypothetical protein